MQNNILQTDESDKERFGTKNIPDDGKIIIWLYFVSDSQSLREQWILDN